MIIPVEQRLLLAEYWLIRLMLAIDADRPRLSDLAMLIVGACKDDEVARATDIIFEAFFRERIGTASGIMAAALVLHHAAKKFEDEMPPADAEKMRDAIAEFVVELLRTFPGYPSA